MENLCFKNQLKEALLRRKEVQELTGLSRSGLYASIKNGTFPPQIKIGLRAVAWKASQIASWIAEKGQGNSK
jgi:prophage regulatory protein